MTVTMSLEIESGIALGEISQVLSEFGADVCSESDGVSGNFEISNTYFVFCECDGLSEVVTEGANLSWNVGVRGAFHCPIDSLAASANEIKHFLSFLSEKKNVQIYSFFSV
ncbi:hypothetical protein M6G63_06370 [Pseudomonas sp. BYT-5]|uniref:hypothetical protein n=1 Tax=unclassified Pseudomonas TaxID=196821 RepID=UPI00201FDC52|nr:MULTISPECIES: hypothetical protein [unclassified Pseudomonas]URD43875.1 hypothetical protein M6G63_06370 [Pseudomonas sp. BYT-5]URK99215.1 hypothetical protein J5X93_06355 [Pseudomonas sp. BYT-1]